MRGWADRRPPAAALIAGAVCVVLLAAAIVLVVHLRSSSSGGHGRDLAVLGATASLPTAAPTVTDPVTPLASDLPTPTPSLASSAPPSPAVTSTGGPTTTSGAPSYCGSGPLPPGHRAYAICDVGKHTGIPSAGCEVFHGCAWWDSWGATPAGPYDVASRVRSGGDIVVTWTDDQLDVRGDVTSGPIHEWVIRLYTGTKQLRQYEVSTGSRSLTMSGVAPGDYTVWAMALNDSGLSAGMANDVTVTAPVSPSPTPTPTPTATPTPSPTTT